MCFWGRRFCKAILFGMVLFSASLAKAQVKHKEISVAEIRQTNKLYTDLLEKEVDQELTDSVLAHPDDQIPPVLFALSNALFQQDKKEEALFWFYVAQFRASFDINIGSESMKPYREEIVSLYQSEFTPLLFPYIQRNKELVGDILPEVLRYVEENEENYDHGWIYYDGSEALYQPENIRYLLQSEKPLSVIKQKTLTEFRMKIQDGLGFFSDKK